MAMEIMEEEWNKKKEMRKGYRRMKEEMELMRERWRVSELELEVERKRVEWLEGEAERIRNGMVGDGDERMKGRERGGEWRDIEKRVEECVRRVIR